MINNQIKSKNKAINIIQSCKNILHIDSAHRYIELYYNKYEDYLGYNELLQLLNNKQIEIS